MRKLSLFLTGALLLPTAAIAQETPQSSPSQQDPTASAPDSATSQDHKKHEKDKRSGDASADTTAPTPDSGTTGSGTTEPAPEPEPDTAPAPEPAAPTPQR